MRMAATSLRPRASLPGCHTRKLGQIRLRIRADTTTKMGRVLAMVDTRDTGPLSIAQKNSTAPASTSSSLTATSVSAEAGRFKLPSSYTTRGRSEISKKITARTVMLSQYMFQKEI